MPDNSQKKIEKNEERSKSEISLEYYAGFNQANQQLEQAAQINNQRKAHNLADFFDGKDQDDFFNDLNLNFDNRTQNTSLTARNPTNQGRFQQWAFKQSSTP